MTLNGSSSIVVVFSRELSAWYDPTARILPRDLLALLVVAPLPWSASGVVTRP